MAVLENRILVGDLDNPAFEFINADIISLETTQAVALVGQELSVDEFRPVVTGSYLATHSAELFRSSDGKVIQLGNDDLYAINVEEYAAGFDILNVDYGTPMWFYHAGELVGKFYIDSIDRIAKNQYQLNGVSTIGLLDKMYTGGGLFLSSDFETVLKFILSKNLDGTGSAVIPYTIDNDVADITVSGYIPYSTKREALYQLIFSNGVNIVKNLNGDPHFTFVYSMPEAPDPIESAVIYEGGNIEYEKPYSKVEISEHTYLPDTAADSETLFDNSDSETAADEQIWFDDAPVIVSTLATTGSLTFSGASVNGCRVSGIGTLTGIPYTHTTRTISKEAAAAADEKTAAVDDCTMINVLNSQNVLNRLYAFYCPDGNIKKISNAIKFTDQRCGKAYKFTSPFGETVSAYLASMDTTFSAIGKAECEYYENYTPAGTAGLYSHVDIITPEDGEYSGTWTVPEGVTQFKVVLISGGTGGQSGYPGMNGGDATTHTNVTEGSDISAMYYGAEGGDGGDGGLGGNPGRVLEFTVSYATEGTIYSYTLGAGGAGGAATGYIPDTVSELRSALAADDPDTEYTDAEIQALIDSKENTGWSGSPNEGAAGTASTFTDGTTTWSTADSEGYTPEGGVYDPIYATYYAYKGISGTAGGKGGAREISTNGTALWVTTGEDVSSGGTTYRGGSSGNALTSVSGLPEVSMLDYGGNGAGAAVGISRTENPHINGASDQTASWEVKEDGDE